MPQSLAHVPVPKFSAYHIALAEVCAIALWNGYDYQTGKKLSSSDEDFLIMFSTPTFAMLKSLTTTHTLSEIDIRELINVARLKALFRSTQATDFQGAIASYRTTALPIYSGFKRKTLRLPTPYDYATQATLRWSVKFVNNPRVSPNGNHRVPLAVRILFFAMPDMMVFNFSNRLSKAMCFQSRPQAAIVGFNRFLYEGLKRNKLLLDKVQMPMPITLSDQIWLAAKRGEWWQRRVLDLALLLHFRLIYATSQLQNQAQQLAAQWAVEAKP